MNHVQTRLPFMFDVTINYKNFAELLQTELSKNKLISDNDYRVETEILEKDNAQQLYINIYDVDGKLEYVFNTYGSCVWENDEIGTSIEYEYTKDSQYGNSVVYGPSEMYKYITNIIKSYSTLNRFNEEANRITDFEIKKNDVGNYLAYHIDKKKSLYSRIKGSKAKWEEVPFCWARTKKNLVNFLSTLPEEAIKSPVLDKEEYLDTNSDFEKIHSYGRQPNPKMEYTMGTPKDIIKESISDTYSYDSIPVTIDVKGICEIVENELHQSGYEMNYKIENNHQKNGTGYIYDIRIEKKDNDPEDDPYQWINCDINIVPQYDTDKPSVVVECYYMYGDGDRSETESGQLYTMREVISYFTSEVLSD